MRSPHAGLFLALAATAALALDASALTPAAETMLKGLGLDPASKDVLAIAQDRVAAASGEVYTLDGLAAKGDAEAVKAFLVTRDFFRDFRENWDIEFPNDELYDIRYLTETEKAYMARKLMQGPPAVARSPLKPATESFLKELNIGTRSADILSVAEDSVASKPGKVYTLDSLAAKRDENGVKAFIATRLFIRAFRKDASADFPSDDLYNILYLSAEEKAYVSKKLLEAFPKPK